MLHKLIYFLEIMLSLFENLYETTINYYKLINFFFSLTIRDLRNNN